MPYIKNQDRENFDISNLSPQKAGELNYIISEICSKYLKEKGLGYTNCNEVVGVLECVKQEFYRRVTAPYEDIKIEENGDISYKDF
jgi:hypothetical protein